MAFEICLIRLWLQSWHRSLKEQRRTKEQNRGERRGMNPWRCRLHCITRSLFSLEICILSSSLTPIFPKDRFPSHLFLCINFDRVSLSKCSFCLVPASDLHEVKEHNNLQDTHKVSVLCCEQTVKDKSCLWSEKESRRFWRQDTRQETSMCVLLHCKLFVMSLQ